MNDLQPWQQLVGLTVAGIIVYFVWWFETQYRPNHTEDEAIMLAIKTFAAIIVGGLLVWGLFILVGGVK